MVVTDERTTHCINCKGISFKKKNSLDKSNHHVVICQDCNLVQVNPTNNLLNFVDFEGSGPRESKLKELFVQMEGASGWSLKEMMPKEALIKREYFRKKVRIIEKYIKTGRLLDVGCAEGAFLSACLSHDFELYGVEPSKYIYPELRAALPNCNLFNTTLLEAQFQSGYFDIAVLINTIEHLLNPKEIIVELHRILKKGGLLMIETPDVGHWLARLMGKRWFPMLIPDHVVFFSKKTLSSMLQNAGFEIKSIKSSYKELSIRLLFFHLGRIFKPAWYALSALEKIGLADKIVSIPQWDEMIFIVKKPHF